MKRIVKNTSKKDSTMDRYLGALNEAHKETLKTIREGSIITNKKLDNHTEMIGVLMEDVSTLKEDMTVVKEDISTLKEDMTVVKEDVSATRSDLKRKVDYDDFLSLVKRVQKIEAKI